MIDDIVRLNSLYDYYGKLLTENQRLSFNYYYRLDYTLAEIAEYIGISKQGVSENLKRAVKELENFENILKLVEKNEKLRDLLKDVQDNLLYIPESTSTNKVKSLINKIAEELED